MGTMGLLVNTGIICFASQMLRCYTLEKQMLIYLALEHCMFVVRYTLEYLIGSTPRWIADEIQRHDFVEDKHMLGAAADDSDDDSGVDGDDLDEESQRLLLDQDELHIDDDKYVPIQHSMLAQYSMLAAQHSIDTPAFWALSSVVFSPRSCT
jgi:hypothetical protein